MEIASDLHHLGTTVSADCDDYGRLLGHTIWGGLDEDGRLWGWDGTPVPEGKTP